MPAGTIRSAVKRFLAVRRVRGRKEGWRKTTPAEDAKILAAFRKVRKPLGSLVEKNDVWKALPLALREKVFARGGHELGLVRFDAARWRPPRWCG